jgi:phospholipid-binding lipoprotein MlaA
MVAPPPVTVASAEQAPDPSPEPASSDRGADAGAAAAEPKDRELAAALADPADAVKEDYDPWENFNQKMFSFNRQVDKYVVKPAARAYDVVMPAPWQALISRGLDNLRFPARLVNNLLQRKWEGAGRETARFLINSTAGIGGIFDPAGDYFGIEASKADFGQTLGKWGIGPGPYLVLPLLPPLTLRDGLGLGVDTAANPLSYYAPVVWDGLGIQAGETVNERAMNIDRYQGFEDSVLDMYSAVRDAYLRRREQRIRE